MKDLTNNQTYPIGVYRDDKLPRSLQFIIFTNYFFAINALSVFLYLSIVMLILQISVNLIYIIIMLIPALVLSAISVIVSINLLRKSNILLSLFHLLMDVVMVDMINLGPLSNSLGYGLIVGELYWFLMSLLILTFIMSIGSLGLLIFNRTLKSYYLNKGVFRKPWFIRNFLGTSLITSIPFVLVYLTFFNL